MRNIGRNTALVGALALVGCGPASRNPGTGDDDTTVDAADNGNGDGGGSNVDGCSDAAKLVYVVDENNTLATFNPALKTFTNIGQLNCPAGGATPFSMGVDRTATAWVLYSDGELFHVDTTSLACTKTTWGSQLGLTQFGMGFSTDSTGGTTDTLFVGGGAAVDTGSSKLAKIDTSSLSATAVGTITGWPELTGTGSAELWGFFPSDMNGTSTPHVDKIDKTSGHALQTFPQSSLRGTPSAWAFAFWGGDYWIFLAKDLDIFTKVYQIDGMTGAIKGTTPTSGRTIVGAGVSTCAPLIIP